MVIVGLLLGPVVTAVDPVALRPLLVIHHFLKVRVLRIYLVLEVDRLAPDVGRRVLVDSVLVAIELLLRLATLNRYVSSDATVSSSLLLSCSTYNFLVAQLTLS